MRPTDALSHQSCNKKSDQATPYMVQFSRTCRDHTTLALFFVISKIIDELKQKIRTTALGSTPYYSFDDASLVNLTIVVSFL
jgi:hypothetical protein